MKKINLMWQGLLLSALALGFASCEPSDAPCPNKKEADGNTDQGVTVVLEMENVVTGETTRTALGENGYSFTPYEAGANGDVQVLGLGRKQPRPRSTDVDVALTYYAKENVVFQGWSWRYSEDPKGTHRGKTDAKQNDYVATPALQPESGVQKLGLGADATSFTCQYRPNTDNKVYVKVKYSKDDRKLAKLSQYTLDIHSQEAESRIAEIVHQMYGYDLSSYDFHFLSRLEKPGLTINSKALGRIKFGRLNTLEYVVQQHLRAIEAGQDKISECLRALGGDYQFHDNNAAEELERALTDYHSSLDTPRMQAESYLYLIKETMKKNPLAEFYTFSDTGDPLYME